MWLTFSTVAGGIYFHEFENAHTFQWIALILGMMLNYFGLYHLVPTASDQPILIINMDKPLKKKVDDDEDEIDHVHNTKPSIDSKQHKQTTQNSKRKQVHVNIDDINQDIDYGSDSATSQQHRKMKKNVVIKFNKSYKNDKKRNRNLKTNTVHTDDDDDDDDNEESDSIDSIDSIDSSIYMDDHHENDEDGDEQAPLLHTSSNKLSKNKLSHNNEKKADSWYQRFVAKRR